MAVALTPRFCALIEYDGTDFLGYQIQAVGRTVQGEIEQALQKVTQTKVRVHGAGRTDAGVHASGQVISFNVAWRHQQLDLHRALNATLPPDIVINNLTTVNEAFHPRFSAVSRSYRYTVINQTWPTALQRHYAYHVSEPLDLAAMNKASQILIGSHDFASFGKPPQGTATIRRVSEAKWSASGKFLTFEISANAFLYRMVRKIVGTLIRVGLGQINNGDVKNILNARNLTSSAPPAPAHGLCLVQVTYPESIWDRV